MSGGGLYIHVPLCASRCDYCNFASTADGDPRLPARLVEGIVRELELRREQCPLIESARRRLRTVYVGGGTPSLLGGELMRCLLAGTAAVVAPDAVETTAEANPESFSDEVASAWRDASIDRVSLGVQSLDDRVLRLLGRRCDASKARRALKLACDTFPRVSADWILAPTVDAGALRCELAEAVGMGVEHVSLYILEVHPGTRLAARIAAGEVPAPVETDVERDYLAAVECLDGLGLRQYEVSNFCRPGAESQHNGSYWRREPSLALGPAAHGFWGRRRYANPADPRDWLACIESGRLPESAVEMLDVSQRRLERLFLGLRTVAGVPVADLPAGALDLERGARERWWTVERGRLRLTARGFLRLDSVEERLARSLPPTAAG